MTDAPTLAAFVVASFLVELTPGPNMAYLALIAATEGRRQGFAAVAGVALGLAMQGLGATMGLSTLVAEVPAVYQAIRWTGILYLLWLAWDAVYSDSAPVEFAGPGSTLARYFTRGLVTNLLNPKAALFYITVLPGFLSAAPPMADVLTLSVAYVTVATLAHAGLVLAAGTAHGWLSDPARERRARQVMAVGLVAVATWVLWKT